MDVTKPLAKCGLAFRVHDETVSSFNRGNFCEVVEFVARWDPTLSSYMANSHKHCTYLSNRATPSYVAVGCEKAAELRTPRAVAQQPCQQPTAATNYIQPC